MCPRKTKIDGKEQVKTWELGADMVLSEPVQTLQDMLNSIDKIIEEVPPDTGPRRFGNVAFRKWYEVLQSRTSTLLEQHLPAAVVGVRDNDLNAETALDELTAYLLGGFGSAQRLDYGTGHELSFLAFLGCIWKLGGFSKQPGVDGALERSIVLGIIEPYLRVVRRLILTYTLEPAGSHGVWGLDDHFFIPYIFGSAQYCPAIADQDIMPVEGTLPGSPKPGDIAKKNVVDRERTQNMYFAAVGFINDVKTGPFWEHSPILFDISGVRSGWGKINKGMIKMYNAEVLSKFPVVQHFPFGSLFSWEQDPNAVPPPTTVHSAHQPSSHSISVTGDTGGAPTGRLPPQEVTRAPRAAQPSIMNVPTAAPWAKVASTTQQAYSGGMPPTTGPWASNSASSVSMPPTRAPWASTASSAGAGGSDAPTRAPWANLPTRPADSGIPKRQ